MYTKLFINDFVTLGNLINPAFCKRNDYSLVQSVFDDSYKLNPFFTESMQKTALEAICTQFLSERALQLWLEPVLPKIRERETEVAVIMAGNIPLVGFHDLLSVLACGFKAEVKLSSKDKYLPAAVIETLFKINPYWRSRISVVPAIGDNPYAVIAAGSDDSIAAISKRYNNSTLLLRGSRSSVAILSGGESDNAIGSLGIDIFSYFGLGCRSVSTLFVPLDFDLNRLVINFEKFKDVLLLNDSYAASYKQKRALLTINGIEFFDGGFFLLSNFEKFPPPLSCINLLRYSDISEVADFLDTYKDSIQAVCSADLIPNSVKFGQMQYPSLRDYADSVDTLDFLLKDF